MVTIAQGKFSKPRSPKLEEPVQPLHKKVAADPIEKAEADIVRFMDNASKEMPIQSGITDETIIVADAVLQVYGYNCDHRFTSCRILAISRSASPISRSRLPKNFL